MFGLDKKPKGPFRFDLEIELGSDNHKKEKLIHDIEHKKGELKNFLRSGGNKEDLEEGGILLQGYDALLHIIKFIPHTK